MRNILQANERTDFFNHQSRDQEKWDIILSIKRIKRLGGDIKPDAIWGSCFGSFFESAKGEKAFGEALGEMRLVLGIRCDGRSFDLCWVFGFAIL